MPIQLSEVVNDPDFAQYLQGAISRSSGSFVKGRFVNVPSAIDFYGIVQPASPEELDIVPEADRVKGAMTFHSQQVLYETHTDGQPDVAQGISDIMTWRSQRYKLVKVFPWEDFGYYKAIGVRMSGV